MAGVAVVPRVPLVAAVFAALLASGGAHGAEEVPVWFWYSGCGSKSIALSVAFDHRLIRAETIPICRAKRGSAAARGQDRQVSFPFLPKRTMLWQGYPVPGTTEESPASARLRIDIWEAGAEPDALILGVSVSGDRGTYMNTLVPVRLDRPNRSLVGDGLVVEAGATDLPIMGKLRPGGLASTARVESNPALLEEFITFALGFKPGDFVFISDLTTINGFDGEAGAARIRARIHEHFGIDVAQETVLVADILDQIQRKRAH